jgi:hypothetical protein
MLLGWLASFLSVGLNLLVAYFAVSSGATRKYSTIPLFCLVQVAAVVTVTSLSFLDRHIYATGYWISDLLAHFFITLVIVSLIRSSVANDPKQRTLPIVLFSAMLGLAAYSLYAFYDNHYSRWLNPVSRNLSLGEEALNLILWTFLLQKRDYDSQLVVISAGIGVQVTGEVIGLTLRPYTSAATVWVPNLLVQTCEFLCLFIWLWAFAPRKSATPAT